MDPAFARNSSYSHELLKTLDVPSSCQLEGWEGDDTFGYLARRGEAEGYQMLLFTGDSDMYQLRKTSRLSLQQGRLLTSQL